MATPPVVSPSNFSQPPSNSSGDDQLNTNGFNLANKDGRKMQFSSYNFTQETGYPPASDDPAYPFGRPVPETGVDYPRRRAIMACEICRSRKSRCDGQKPRCKLCTELNADCIYREPGVKLDAGDKLILERLSRIEGLIQASIPRAFPPGLSTSSPLFGSEVGSNSGTTRPMDRNFASTMPVTGLGTWSTSTNISTMPEVHTNAALHLLRWPMIRNLVSKPYDPHILLQLELSREPLDIVTSRRMELSQSRTNTYAQTFFESVNIWYACVDPFTWATKHRNAVMNGFRDGTDTCLVLLVLALGEASCGGTISRVPKNQDPPGFSYFSAAWQIIPSLMTRNTVESIQCMVLASAYLFYLLRPLEAWTLLSSISTKLQLLLSAPNRIPLGQKELCMRIYWNALLFESDLLAELDLPHSGIVNFEESVGLPGGFEGSPREEVLGRDNLWYFLAEIALRRLLNRVSTLIYSQDSMVATASLEPIVNELDFQLTQWYESLPPVVRFSIAEDVASQSHVQTVLRLRYFACRTIIYRPYILAVLDDPAVARDPAVMANCTKCMDACIRQLDPISAHHSGSLPYAFQGALSIVSQTLLVMGASMCPTLQPLLPDGVDAIIDEVLAEMKFYRDLAPSLGLSFEILREAEDRRRIFLSGDVAGVGIV